MQSMVPVGVEKISNDLASIFRKRSDEMPKHYLGWLASPDNLPNNSDCAAIPGLEELYWAPNSHHITMDKLLVPFKAVVDANNETAAWQKVERGLLKDTVRRRYCLVWKPEHRRMITEFVQRFGFQLLFKRSLDGQQKC